MTRQVNIAEAKAKLSELVEAASRGEEIVLARYGRPVARLAPLAAAPVNKPREFGQQEESARHIDWDQWWRDWKAMDAEIEADFERSEIFPRSPNSPRGAKAPRGPSARRR